METRPINLEQDYSTLEGWWLLNKWPAFPRDLLPPTGLIVPQMAAGFLYLTDTPIAWLELVVSNPLCDRINKDKALDLIIVGLLDKAVRAGNTMVFSSISHPRLMERYKAQGATAGDTNMTNFIWRLR